MMIHSVLCTSHKEKKLCTCGDNMMCFNCGHGKSSHPCRCNNRPTVRYITDKEHERYLEESLILHKDIWEEMAKR